MLANTFQRQLISSSSYLGNRAYAQQLGKKRKFLSDYASILLKNASLTTQGHHNPV